MTSKFKLVVVVAIALLTSPFVAIAHGDGDEGHGDMEQHMARMSKNRDALKARMGARYEAPVRAAKPGETEKGRQIFQTICQTCHGASGQGNGPAAQALNPPPANFTDPMHAYFYSDAARLEIIHSGSAGSAMPPWKGVLNEEQIMEVFQYIRSLRPEKEMEGHHSDHAETEMEMDHAAKEKLEATDQGVHAVLSFGAGEPTPGSETKMELIFTSLQKQKAVDVREVSMKWSMPNMGHDLATKKAEPHGRPGVFSASYRFPMAGRFQVDISAKTGGKALTYSFLVIVGNNHEMKGMDHMNMQSTGR